ncbi:GGDEF domain-containing protein [Tautonia sociabilis]|nr:GGDEF domain-containing protein [Tautonia sociabilis]
MDDNRLHHPLAGPIVSRFLVEMGGGAIAQLDPNGVILRASERLSVRMPEEGGGVELSRMLVPRSARGWRKLLDRLKPGGPARRLLLRLRGEGPPIVMAGLVHREADGSVWLLAVPALDADSLGAARELARELAGLKRHMARSDRMARLIRKARREARTDPLTGLANRRQGVRWFREAIAQHRPEGAPLGCVVLDIDYFKAINDTFGHPVGDRVLRVAARIVSEQLRPLDRLFRYGGEEFVVLLPETGLDEAVVVADRIRAALGSRQIRPLGGPLSASFGVACLRPGESAASLFHRADRALVRAKRLGRDRVEADR